MAKIPQPSMSHATPSVDPAHSPGRLRRFGLMLGVVLVAIAYLWLAGALLIGQAPATAAVALLPLVLSVRAARNLIADAEHPARLVPPIRDTIAAANLSGVLLALGLGAAGLLA